MRLFFFAAFFIQDTFPGRLFSYVQHKINYKREIQEKMGFFLAVFQQGKPINLLSFTSSPKFPAGSFDQM